MSSNANAWRNLSTAAASTIVSGVSNMLKQPNSPLPLALVAARPAADDARDDTTSVTAGNACAAGSVIAWSKLGRTLGAAVSVVLNRLRDGTRSHDGIDGIPTDHPPAECADEGAEVDAATRTSEVEPDTDGG